MYRFQKSSAHFILLSLRPTPPSPRPPHRCDDQHTSHPPGFPTPHPHPAFITDRKHWMCDEITGEVTHSISQRMQTKVHGKNFELISSPKVKNSCVPRILIWLHGKKYETRHLRCEMLLIIIHHLDFVCECSVREPLMMVFGLWHRLLWNALRPDQAHGDTLMTDFANQI